MTPEEFVAAGGLAESDLAQGDVAQKASTQEETPAPKETPSSEEISIVTE